ncbi:MAG TPA: hypothetical protein VGB07_13595 [Blastocatellia bacterium]|jgi:hypothetical protein
MASLPIRAPAFSVSPVSGRIANAAFFFVAPNDHEPKGDKE